MRRLALVLSALLGVCFGPQSPAQVVNSYPMPPATKMESLDTNVDCIILKATSEVGSLSLNAGVVSVRFRESTDLSSGRREQGIVIEIVQRGQPRDTLLIDHDECLPLSTAMNYLNKVDFGVTPLNAFDAVYTTKGGFRVAVVGVRATGAIQYAIRDARIDSTPIVLSRQDLSRLGALIDQAKAKIDLLGGS